MAAAKKVKVKMLSIMAGPEGVKHPGDIVEFDEKTAEALIKGNAAELVEEKKVNKEPE